MKNLREVLGIAKQTAHLEDWENYDRVLTGIVTGHPLLRDGMFIRTSQIILLAKDLKSCETLNTHYTLGTPKSVEG